MTKWFLMSGDETTGPFSTEQVKSLHKNHLVEDTALIWSRQMDTWAPLTTWMANIDDILSTEDQKKIQTWYFALNSKKYGPYNRSELISQLIEQKEHLKHILLWTKGMKNWNSLFDFLDVIDELGINARQVPRASIEAQFLTEGKSGEKIHYPIATISENGMGLLNAQGLIAGDELKGEVISGSFSSRLYISAEVRYVDDHGFAGLFFTQINMESKQTIITYVKNQTMGSINQSSQKAA